MITAEKLFKTLEGFVAMNISFDKKNGSPDKAILKARAANYGLIRNAIIGSDFITAQGLDKQYRKYEKKVDMEVAEIAARGNNGKM